MVNKEGLMLVKIDKGLSVIAVRDYWNYTVFFSQVRICYIDTLQMTMERQIELQKMYYFHCDCLYCTDIERDAKMRSMKCSSCLSPVPVPMFLVPSSPAEDIMCPHCQHIILANEVESYLDDEAFSKFQLIEMKNKETNCILLYFSIFLCIYVAIFSIFPADAQTLYTCWLE